MPQQPERSYDLADMVASIQRGNETPVPDSSLATGSRFLGSPETPLIKETESNLITSPGPPYLCGLTIFESYSTGDDYDWDISTTSWSAQTFTPAVGHTITGVSFKMKAASSPGTITASLRATSGGHPTGGDLISATIDGSALSSIADWHEIYFPTGYALNAGTKYAVVIRASGSALKLRSDITSGGYSGGNIEYSMDSGATWGTDATYDFLFQEGSRGPICGFASVTP